MSTPIPPTTLKPLPTMEEALKASVNCLVHYDQDMRLCAHRAKNLGAKSVVLTTQLWQQDRYSSQVEIDPEVTLSMTNTQVFIKEAHSLGLLVVYKPLVNLRDQMAQDNFGWRGNILLDEESEAVWFDSYRSALKTLLVWSKGADGFVVGTEFSSLQGRSDQWRETVSLVRTSMPTAFVAYDANWYGLSTPKDGVASISWWDTVDAIGISAYYPVCKDMESEPSVGDLVQCWQPIQEELQQYASLHSKPLWFAEIGLASRTGRHAQPWDEFHGDPCEECQDNWYRAVITVWASEPNLVGMTWWSLTAEPLSEEDVGFNFLGKLGETTLKEFFNSYR